MATLSAGTLSPSTNSGHVALASQPYRDSLVPHVSRQVGSTSPKPVLFIQNIGQADKHELFRARAGNTTVFVTDQELWFSVLDVPEPLALTAEPEATPVPGDGFGGHVIKSGVNLRLGFVGASDKQLLEPQGRVDSSLSYFLGE